MAGIRDMMQRAGNTIADAAQRMRSTPGNAATADVADQVKAPAAAPAAAPTEPAAAPTTMRSTIRGIDVGERPFGPADAHLFPDTPAAAAEEAAHGARMNPPPAPSTYTSSGYADHFAPEAANSPGSTIRSTIGDVAKGTGALQPSTSLAGRAVTSLARGAAKVLGPVGVVGGLAEAGQGINEGDYAKAGLGAADAAAGAAAMTGVGTVPALAYGAARGGMAAGQGVYDHMGQPMRDAIGGTVNNVARMFGGGYDGTPQDAERAGYDATGRLPPATTMRAAAPGASAGGTVLGGRGTINPPMASATGDARPDLAGMPSLGGSTGTVVDGAPGTRKFVTADGRTLYSNVPGSDNDKLMSAHPGIQTVPSIGGTGAGGGAADIARLQAEYRANGGDSGALTTTPGTSVMSGRTIFDDNRADAGAGAGTGGKGSPRRLQAAALAREQMASTRDIAEGQMATSRNNAQLSSDTQIGTTGMNNRATMRGQDISAGTARLQGRLQQMQNDRTYGLDAAKFGQEQAKTNYDQREKSVKDTHDEISSLLPPIMVDGKQAPDTATAARYMAGLTAQMGARESELEQRAKGGDKQAAADLDTLRTKGMGAITRAEKQRFVTGMQAADLAQANHSSPLNPFGGRAVIDPRPVSSMRKTSNGLFGLGGEYTTSRGDTIPARVIERDGSFFGGQRNRTYDSLK